MPDEALRAQMIAAPPNKRWIDNIAAVSSALIALGTLLNWFFGREFKGVMNDLNTLIRFCTCFYFKKPFNGREASDLTKDEIKEVEFAHENFVDFLRRYQIFYDEVSGRLGSTTRAHFEIPKPLTPKALL